MGDVTGRHICDLACGQGRNARHLADRGASVVGVDISSNMLEIARRYETDHPRGIEYRLADVRALDGFQAAEFDGVMCYMALMDVADLEPTVRSVYHMLRSGGWFVFAILHPCYNTARSGELAMPDGLVRTTGSYFVEGHFRADTRTGPPGKVGVHHRMLSTYLNALIAVSFRLERFAEPAASGRLEELRPIWSEVPNSIVVRCSKPSV